MKVWIVFQKNLDNSDSVVGIFHNERDASKCVNDVESVARERKLLCSYYIEHYLTKSATSSQGRKE